MVHLVVNHTRAEIVLCQVACTRGAAKDELVDVGHVAAIYIGKDVVHGVGRSRRPQVKLDFHLLFKCFSLCLSVCVFLLLSVSLAVVCLYLAMLLSSGTSSLMYHWDLHLVLSCTCLTLTIAYIADHLLGELVFTCSISAVQLCALR